MSESWTREARRGASISRVLILGCVMYASLFDPSDLIADKTVTSVSDTVARRRSLSGQWELTISSIRNTTKPQWEYAVANDGRDQWKRKFPFVLVDAFITNSGVVAGYGYVDRHSSTDSSELVVVVVDAAAAKVMLVERSERKDLGAIDAELLVPFVNGIAISESGNRFLVRVHDENAMEAWWTYSLSTGVALEKLTPRVSLPDDTCCMYVADVRSIAGTPLFLVHWHSFGRTWGAVFTAVDIDGMTLWKRVVPIESGVLDTPTVMRRAKIADGSRNGQFAIDLLVESQRVQFAVDRQADNSWSVVEKARARIPVAAPRLR